MTINFSGAVKTVLTALSAKLPAALGPASKSGSLSVTPPSPTATAVLTASAPLPAAGAYEAAPADNACVTIPLGSRKATIGITYTQGAGGGQSAHKVYMSDGTTVFQVQAVDGTYAGTNGIVGTSKYALDVDVSGGSTKIGLASAEVGVAGTPGTVASSITFG